MKFTTITASALLAVAPVTASGHHKHGVEARGLKNAVVGLPTKGQATYQGCYKSLGPDMKAIGIPFGVTSGGCAKVCADYNVFALQGSNCYCGAKYPAKDTTATLSKCDVPCEAWKDDPCPLEPLAAIFNTGKLVDVDFAPNKTKSSSSSSDKASATDDESASTAVKTAVVTQTQSSDSDPNSSEDPKKKKGGSSNTVGIAVGVVVGVVVVAALVGGVFFWLRRKRNAEIEEDHRRNAAVNAFISGSKPPSTSGSLSMTDARLDPVMAHRRLSDGSIADNEDYSRRILRVTNA